MFLLKQITKADLEQRHPQLDYVFTLAQNLKNKASSSDVRTAITEKLEKVKNQWDNTQHGVELRQQQLEDMVIDSLQWDDHREETEELMRKYEARLYILQQARRDPLIKQISDNQVRVGGYFLASSIYLIYFFVLFTVLFRTLVMMFSQGLRIYIEVYIKNLTMKVSEKFLEV